MRTGPVEDTSPSADRPRRYTDVQGIAEHLAITERHVRRLVLERRIPHRKVGNLLRFDIHEVDRWMDTLRRGPTPRPPERRTALAGGHVPREATSRNR